MSSRLFSTVTRTTRHSHAAKGHNLNHLHSHKAPDKGIRYVNRPQYRHGLPMSFPNRSGIIHTPTRSRTRLPIFDSNNIIYAEARTITTSTKAPVHGMSSDGASKSMNQMDNEGWVDPEEMPTLSSFARSVTEDNEYEEPSKQVSSATRRKNIAGMASAVPTDSEAAVSADKMDMSPQEMVQQTTKKARKQKMKSIEEDEKPTSLRDDSDVASLSTQGRVGNTVEEARSRQGQEAHEAQGKYEMSGKQNSSGKMNEDMSHPASYGSNPKVYPSHMYDATCHHVDPCTTQNKDQSSLGCLNVEEAMEIESSKEGADHSTVCTAISLEEEEMLRQKNEGPK